MNNANTQSVVWRRGIIVGLLLLVSTVATPAAHAQSRLVVRDSLGLPGINLTCALLGCNVVQAVHFVHVPGDLLRGNPSQGQPLHP